ncbi:MAG: type II toxin-antitoxin system VapC family toxin [Candidatus Thioglobus sp.]|nr:MAG: type II toxin-antitoxin system VapC family toxin [Candidatus Thioglobus sp.]
MNILIDTHILLWIVKLDKRLKQKHIKLLSSTENNFYFSVASLAEIMIKVKTGKLIFDDDIAVVADKVGFKILDLKPADVLALKTMSRHHNDPFDRMLISQSINRGLPILTYDEKFKLYDCKLIEV